jgi:hypothetical protein
LARLSLPVGGIIPSTLIRAVRVIRHGGTVVAAPEALGVECLLLLFGELGQSLLFSKTNDQATLLSMSVPGLLASIPFSGGLALQVETALCTTSLLASSTQLKGLAANSTLGILIGHDASFMRSMASSVWQSSEQ